MTFKRENRYYVIKRKDLDAIGGLTPEEYEVLNHLMNILPERQYVVVEDDWPEYEKVWQMIEERVGQA